MEISFLLVSGQSKPGKPKLQQAQWRYHSARKHPLPIIGAFTAEAKYGDVSKTYPVSFLVSEIPGLNVLGRAAIRAIRISLDDLLFSEATFDKDGSPAAGYSSV